MLDEIPKICGLRILTKQQEGKHRVTSAEEEVYHLLELCIVFASEIYIYICIYLYFKNKNLKVPYLAFLSL